MSKLVAPIILIVLGVIVIAVGKRRADSVAGVTDSVGVKIANAWDGSVRQPDHIWYFVGGGALIVAGVAMGLRKGKGA